MAVVEQLTGDSQGAGSQFLKFLLHGRTMRGKRSADIFMKFL